MTSLKGYCERCGNHDSYLKKVDGNWLCKRCREEQKRFVKPKIPFLQLINPFKKKQKV